MLRTIRVRLTVWYVSIFACLLIVFSIYVYSLLARDLERKFDGSLLRAAHITANYLAEFYERNKATAGAQETVRDAQFGLLRVAIAREGKIIAASDAATASVIQSAHIIDRLRSANAALILTDAGKKLRLAGVRIQIDRTPYAAVVLEPLAELNDELARVRRTMFFPLLAALVLAALGGFIMAGKSLQPIVTISSQAERISAKNLNERLHHVSHPADELSRLTEVINSLLARLDSSFRIMRDFIADASHNLRTPVTIIQSEADVTLSQDRSCAEYQRSLEAIREQSKRIAKIVTDMLVLARADAGQQSVHFEELYLNELVEECCQGAQTISKSAGVGLSFQHGEDVPFRGNEELLRGMVTNLLDNAIRYTPAGGSVTVRLVPNHSFVELTIADTGVGIPREDNARVFDRFYRVPNSRNASNTGSGLGLAIVKMAAEAHAGSVAVSSEPGRGSTFTVTLPLVAGG